MVPTPAAAEPAVTDVQGTEPDESAESAEASAAAPTTAAPLFQAPDTAKAAPARRRKKAAAPAREPEAPTEEAAPMNGPMVLDSWLAAAEGDPSQEAPEAVTPKEGEQPLPADIAELSYEAARDQLVEVVRRLESGQGGLEDSIALWERGEMLARRCQQWLDGARERLDDAVAARRSEDASER